MNYKKQIVIGIMALLISLICSTTCMATTAIVNTDTLKLRKEASTDSTILELLNQGEKLEIIEESGDWYKVKVNKMTGYVHKDYVKVDEDTTETETEESKTEETTNQEQTTTNQEESSKEENNTNQEQTVNEETNTTETKDDSNNIEEKKESLIGKQTLKSDSNAYILPLINSSKIGKLDEGVEVEVLDEVKGWVYIQTDDINAWIRTDVLKETTSNTTSNNDEKKDNDDIQEQEIEKKVMYVNTSSIYVRKGPATTYEVVDTLVQNNQVTAIAESGDWYKVELGSGTQGYIAKRLLSSSKEEITSRSAEERTTGETEEIAKAEQAQTSESTTTSSSKGEEIVEYAKQFLGCKYVYGGSGPSTFDCSGFTMYVYKNFGISLSHSARAQSSNGTYVSKEELEPGDLVFFKDYETMDGIGHCGIYIGDGNFIHASSGTGYCVKISTLLSGSYNTRYETARRLI